ncbi:MAG: radical SAM protein [Armatimonadetes bacterium]|nr:radical SAM protein [Armatimonadota bacterium]
MANVLLVSYAGYPYTPSSLCPDNGLALLAAVLKQAGHHVLIADFGTLATMRRLYPEELSRRVLPVLSELMASAGQPKPEHLAELGRLDAQLEAHQAQEVQAIAHEIAQLVEDLEPAFVGFKLWNGDGFTGSVVIAEELRRRFPSLKFFAGGPHATWGAHYIYHYTDAFDAVMLGEGEERILDLLAHATEGKSLDGVPGLIRSAEDRATPSASYDLAELPTAIYDEEVYPSMAGDEKLKMLVVDDSRGCPYRCAFCTHPYESGRRLRLRPAERLAEDMALLSHQPGVRAFRFAGSSTPGSLMAEVAHNLVDQGLDVTYTTFAHFASSAPDHFELMRRSGLYAMFFGLESGSQDLLRRATGKPIKIEEVKETVRAAQAAGIKVACSVIVPLPFETEETLGETLDFLVDLRPDSVPVQFPGLLPGTPWFDRPEHYGFELDRDEYLRENLNYKFKLLFPPTFWKPLPYRLNGQDFTQFVKTTGRFVAALESEGILTDVPDDNMLMAHLGGLSDREFRDRARLWCVAGLVDAMRDFVLRYNKAATSPPED